MIQRILAIGLMSILGSPCCASPDSAFAVELPSKAEATHANKSDSSRELVFNVQGLT